MNKRLTILSALTIMVLIATFIALQIEDKQTSPVDTFKLLLPGFANEAEGITRIHVQHRRKRIRVFRDENDVWRVKEFANYVAKKSILQKLVQDLAESERLQKKTARKELLSELGLDDKQATRLRFYGDEADPEPIVDILVGRFSKKQRGTYVRMTGSTQAWLASGDLTTESKALHWLNQDIFSINEERISKLTTYRALNNGEEEEIILSRDNPLDGLFIVNIPDEQKFVNTYHMNMLPKSFINMVFADVMPEKSLKKDKNIRYLRVELETFDGLMLDFDIHGIGADWAIIKAKCDREKSIYLGADKDRILQLENMGILSADVACSQAKAISKRTEGWVYRFPPYKLSMLKRNYSEITGRQSEASKKPVTEKRKQQLLKLREASPFDSEDMQKLKDMLNPDSKLDNQ